MEEFILLSRKNTPYKVYKRKYKWTPQDLLYNVRLIPYYRKFLEVASRGLELGNVLKGTRTVEEQREARIAIAKFRLNSRKELREIKDECTGN